MIILFKLKCSAKTQEEGKEEYRDRRSESRPDDKLTRKGNVAAHFLNHRNTGNCYGCCKRRNESRKLRRAEAILKAYVSRSDNENGNYNCSENRSPDYLALERGNCRELELRAENEKRIPFC